MGSIAQRIFSTMAGAFVLLAVSCSTAFAQCAMCRAALGNSTEAARAASGMNMAVLVLLIPPVAMFCAFFIAAYRYRKAPGESVLAEQASMGAHVSGALREGKARGRIKTDGDGPRAISEAT